MADIVTGKNLSFAYSMNTSFSHTAVDHLNFSVHDGEILGIIGHTGSGKSTLLQLLNGLLRPTAGMVCYQNRDIWENPKEIRKIRSEIGLVFQYPEYQLFEETCEKDIAFAPTNMGVSPEETRKIVRECIRFVDLDESVLSHSPFDLSGGQKRRVAIAGVMAMQPKVLVLDEPTAGLDPAGKECIYQAILNYRREKNATIIIVSHSMEDVARYCDRVMVINDSHIVKIGSVHEVFSDEEFLQSIGLNVPAVTAVLHTLQKYGIPVRDDCYTPSAAAKMIIEMLKGGEADVD